MAQHIVSGSLDETIRVWNAMTGETAVGPFMGHTDSVLYVAFSPDGQHIISGSGDRTIRMWNAMTGATAVGPFWPVHRLRLSQSDNSSVKCYNKGYGTYH